MRNRLNCCGERLSNSKVTLKDGASPVADYNIGTTSTNQLLNIPESSCTRLGTPTADPTSQPTPTANPTPTPNSTNQPTLNPTLDPTVSTECNHLIYSNAQYHMVKFTLLVILLLLLVPKESMPRRFAYSSKAKTVWN